MQHGPPALISITRLYFWIWSSPLQPQIWGCMFSANLEFVFFSNAIQIHCLKVNYALFFWCRCVSCG